VYLDDRMIVIIFVLSVFLRINLTILCLDFCQLLKFIGHRLMPAHGVTYESALAKKKGIDENDTETKIQEMTVCEYRKEQ